MQEHRAAVVYLLELKDGQLASGSDDSTIKLWNVSSMKCIQTLSDHRGSVYCLCQLHNDRFASCSMDFTIKIWNQNTFQCQTTLIQNDVIRFITQLSDLSLATA